jgi:hypothetical protein
VSDVSTQADRVRLLAAARGILEGAIPLLEGVRIITACRSSMNPPDAEPLLNIAGVESETDIFPQGRVRQEYEPQYLRQLDERLAKYLAVEREGILDDCREILRRFSEEP